MKKRNLFIVSVLLFLCFITNINAAVVKVDESINEKGNYNSTKVFLGNRIKSEANIDGISFVAGNDIELQQHVTYGLYAGNSISINEYVEKDLFIAGNNIEIGAESTISRDAFIAGNIVTVKSNIGRNLRIAASNVDLSGVIIDGNATIYADTITMNENTVIKGKLTYAADSLVNGINKSNVGEIKIVEAKEEIKITVMDQLKSFVISILAAFITMAVIIYLRPKIKEKLEAQELTFNKIFRTIIIGLITLIVVPILVLITVLSGFLTPLALIVGVLYIISLYISHSLVYYIVGKLIMDKAFKQENAYLALFFGVIVVKVIFLIPVIGGLFDIFSLLYGLGLIYKYVYTKE